MNWKTTRGCGSTPMATPIETRFPKLAWGSSLNHKWSWRDQVMSEILTSLRDFIVAFTDEMAYYVKSFAYP